jgi:hypothetical protein
MKFLAVYVFLCSILAASALDAKDFEAMMMKSPEYLETKIITINAEDDLNNVRRLQFEDSSGSRCYSTNDDRRPNRYCTFADAPREGTFLMLACPDSKGDDLSLCECTIGVGKPEEAPNTDTCSDCGFCTDGTLAYDCRNVAEGTCIGRNCRGDCVSSMEEPEDLLIEAIRSTGSGTSYNLSGLLVPIAAMLLY